MEKQLELLGPYLDMPYIRRVRRNHGLEHATIHLLSRKVSHLRMVGRSDAGGFWLIGDAPTELVESSVNTALTRMRGGEHDLAVHPNCGTNLVTVALLGTAAALVALIGSQREKGGMFTRIPLVAMGIMFAMIFGQPMGMTLQKHVTTLGDPGDLEVVEIRRTMRGPMPAHRVITRSS